jgi:hypothetical protein
VVDVEVSTKVSSKAVSPASLADGLANLAIGQNDFEIYEMDWRTKLQLQEEVDEVKKDPTAVASKENSRVSLMTKSKLTFSP